MASLILATVVLLVQATVLLFIGGALFKGRKLNESFNEKMAICSRWLQEREPLHHLTWDWWWWLLMLDDENGNPSGKQLMVLWSTKDNP